MQVIRLLGLPFSLLYSCVLYMRNRFYDWGILKSSKTPIKSIVVGNLSLGGTGKSPMVEYLIRHFISKEDIAMVSRGFGRKTQGMIIGSPKSSASDIGDEPMQILGKFPSIRLIVDSNRNNALDHASETKCSLAILDDAYQHRAVAGDCNILLTRFDRPWFSDRVIPSGTLRDHPRERKRANLVVVTNSPTSLSEKERITFSDKLRVNCPVYFASTVYLPLRNVFTNEEQSWPKKVVVLSGIANPSALITEITSHSLMLNHLKFPDHHAFSPNDIKKLRDIIGSFADPDVALITTEKDTCRLQEFENELVGITVLVLPIQINIHDDANFKRCLDQKL